MNYRIAVATSDGKQVDTHFGHASSFLILEVDEDTGSYEDVEERAVNAACGGGTCGSAGDGSAGDGSAENGGVSSGRSNSGDGAGHDVMNSIAATLQDADYVLCAKIGPHAVRALARYNIAAYDIMLPIDEAVKKIHLFRQKIKARRIQKTTGQQTES